MLSSELLALHVHNCCYHILSTRDALPKSEVHENESTRLCEMYQQPPEFW